MSVDSRSRPPALQDAPPAVATPEPETGLAETRLADSSPSAASRLGRWIPRLAGLVTFANRVALVSAISAGVLWWALAGQAAWGLGAAAWGPALGLAVLFLIPAASAWLLGLTLHDILTLPETLRQGAVAAAQTSREALTDKRRGRIVGLISAIWAAREFVMDSKGAWAKAAMAARVVRLAKLPFILGLTGLFLLNGVVILAGLIALAVLVV